jgi:hypothetical protein
LEPGRAVEPPGVGVIGERMIDLELLKTVGSVTFVTGGGSANGSTARIGWGSTGAGGGRRNESNAPALYETKPAASKTEQPTALVLRSFRGAFTSVLRKRARVVYPPVRGQGNGGSVTGG